MMGNNWSMMGVLNFHLALHDFVPILDGDGFFPNLHVAPLAIVAVLARIIGIKLFFENIGGVRAAGGHGDRAITAVAQTGKGRADNRHAGNIGISGIDADLVKAKLAVPAQMRIDDRHRHVHRRTSRREQNFVGASIGDFVGPNPGLLQITARLSHRPAPDDVSAQCDNVPGLNLLRPGRDLFRVLFHELPDALLIGLHDSPHFWADLAIFLPADFGVTPHALDEVVPKIFRTKHFGHGAVGFAVILEQLFEPIFRLGVADGVGGRFEIGGEDVWNAKSVAVDGGLLCTAGQGLRKRKGKKQ